MMDAYSYQSGPTLLEAIEHFKKKIQSEHKPVYLERCIINCLNKEIRQYGGLGSYSGWLVFTQPSIWKQLLRRETIWKKCFFFMRVVSAFIKN
jgi:hypothetical protein